MENASVPEKTGEAPRRNIDLERREDRFIIFIRDTQDIINAFSEFADVIEYPKTPVTQTLYMGDWIRGLPAGLSIKARTYSLDRLTGRWDLDPNTIFNLLEIKRTVSMKGEAALQSAVDFDYDFLAEQRGYEEVFEVLDLAAKSFPSSSMKSKKRTSTIAMAGVLDLLSNPTAFHGKIPDDLYLFLLENVYPMNDFDWMPLTGTEYRRMHFKTKDPESRDIFRATLDTRVMHYSFRKIGEKYLGTPVGVEDYSRLELKADYEKLKNTPLGRRMSEIILDFKAFRIPSKKYRGLTLRGWEIIQKYGFKNEVPSKIIKGWFVAKPIRYKDREHYVNLARYIKTSGSFRLFEKLPVLLEEHINSVLGTDRKLTVRLTGNSVFYERPPIVKLKSGLNFSVSERNPVAEIPTESREELNLDIFKTLKEKNNEYVRSKGFLVESKKTRRVYKVSLEREMHGKKKNVEDVCIMYIGRDGNINEFDIVGKIEEEITALYRFLRKYPLFKSIN